MAIASFVARLAPLGVFALVGVAAGTMRPDELIRLQVYVYSYVVFALLLSFWVVPGLVTALLPISYREFMRSAQTALITAFATGSLLVALPLVAEGAKKALAGAGSRNPDSDGAVDVVVPVNFTLPNLGKLLGLAFVPFAGWLTGFEMSAGAVSGPAPLGAVQHVRRGRGAALPAGLDAHTRRYPAALRRARRLNGSLRADARRRSYLRAGASDRRSRGGVASGPTGRTRPVPVDHGGVCRPSQSAGCGSSTSTACPASTQQDERFRSMDLAASPVNIRVRETLPEGDRVPGESRLDRIVTPGRSPCGLPRGLPSQRVLQLRVRAGRSGRRSREPDGTRHGRRSRVREGVVSRCNGSGSRHGLLRPDDVRPVRHAEPNARDALLRALHASHHELW